MGGRGGQRRRYGAAVCGSIACAVWRDSQPHVIVCCSVETGWYCCGRGPATKCVLLSAAAATAAAARHGGFRRYRRAAPGGALLLCTFLTGQRISGIRHLRIIDQTAAYPRSDILNSRSGCCVLAIRLQPPPWPASLAYIGSTAEALGLPPQYCPATRPVSTAAQLCCTRRQQATGM